MTKVYVAVEAKTKTELFRGTLKEFDSFFNRCSARLGNFVVQHGTRKEKLVWFYPLSAAAAIAFVRRTPREEPTNG